MSENEPFERAGRDASGGARDNFPNRLETAARCGRFSDPRAFAHTLFDADRRRCEGASNSFQLR